MRRYGVSDATTALIVVRIGGPELSAEDVERDMDAVVEGTKVSFAGLRDLTDWTAVKKVRVFNLGPSYAHAWIVSQTWQ